MSQHEPFLETKQRFALYPIEYPDIYECYQKQLACFWVANEVDFAADRNQFDALTPNEQTLVKGILAFFAASDSVVALNITDNFCKDVPVLEAQMTYAYQSMMEGIHSEAYSIMIDVLISDPSEKVELLQNLQHVPSVALKNAWANRYRDGNLSFAQRIVAYVIVEGLFFSSSFAGIFWFKQRNLLPALTKSNTFIARDEGQHVQFGALIYSKLVNKLTQSQMHDMMSDAVEVERKFVHDTLPDRLMGLNADIMCQYVEFVADTLLQLLGYNKLYNRENPLQYMELLGLSGRDNFFESVPSNYQKSAVLNQNAEIAFVEDF